MPIRPSDSIRGKRELSLLLIAMAVLWQGGTSGQALLEAPDSEAEQINALLDQWFNSLAAIYDYRGTLAKRERFGDELIEQTIEFKFSRPFKIYLKYVEPYPGREAIYIRGANRNRVRAHKGSIPDIQASFSPFGRIPMADNHHPITSFGLANMLRVTAYNIRKAIQRADASVGISDGGIVLGDPTWRIDTKSTSGGRYVTVRRSESLWDLAKRVGQNMYVILHHNDTIDSPRDVRPGQSVFVPFHYGSRGKFFCSKRNYMMIKASSWDHQGRLYESSEFPRLELNPGLELIADINALSRSRATRHNI